LPITTIRDFLKMEASGGIVLMFAAALGLVAANSPLDWLYDDFLEVPITIRFGALLIDKPLLLWVNDGLMAVFFFLIGLEIKREFLQGELSSMDSALLPAIAAVGGMVVPALIYVFFNYDDPARLNGWAIPAATDIAFALGILALLGTRAPLALKVFLTAVAVFDDLGAIIIIALFYTEDLSMVSFVVADVGIIALIVLNRLNVMRVAPYVIIGIVVWVCVLKSNVHATLAGVAVALTIPMRGPNPGEDGPLQHLEHILHPWVAFMVLPVFGFANAGVDFSGMTFSSFLDPVTLGIAGGLFVGKQIGIFGLVYACVRFGIAKRPAGTSWLQIYAVSLLCGIGFTMSLFIGALAFDDDMGFAGPVRLGVLTGSILAAILGYLILRYGPAPAPQAQPAGAE